jgi:hypothetical protein
LALGRLGEKKKEENWAKLGCAWWTLTGPNG